MTAPTTARARRPLKPCGTVAAYERHRQHGEEPCRACKRARQEYNREYAARKRGDITAQRRERRERVAMKRQSARLYMEMSAASGVSISEDLLAKLWETATPEAVLQLDMELGAEGLDAILERAA